MRTIEEILDKIKELKGLKTDTDLAEFFGVKPQTISTWRKRKTIPYDLLIAFCEKEDWPIGWLIAGQIPTKHIVTANGQRVLTISKEPGIYNQASPERCVSSEYELIPLVRGHISAGRGTLPENEIDMRVAFRKDWLKRKGSPNMMALIRVKGDSMEPTLHDGDIVLVNMEKKHIDAQGGIYAIAINDEIMIKRLQPLYPEKKIKIISDNQKYDSIIADPDQIKVNGKVIWFARELER